MRTVAYIIYGHVTGRKDGQPFTYKQWANLHSYIYDLMDLYSDGIAPSAKKSYRKLNPAAGISLPLNLQIVIRPPSRSPPI